MTTTNTKYKELPESARNSIKELLRPIIAEMLFEGRILGYVVLMNPKRPQDILEKFLVTAYENEQKALQTAIEYCKQTKGSFVYEWLHNKHVGEDVTPDELKKKK